MAAARIVSDSIVIDAQPEQIFDILADPTQHQRINGSGTLKGIVTGPPRLSLGATFGMKMKQGAPYRVTNTVVEFEENRRIAWHHKAKATWRYELEPTPAGTLVTESYDWSASPLAFVLELFKIPAKNKKSMTQTLDTLKLTLESPTAA